MIRERLLAAALWLATLFTLVMASLPIPPQIPGQPQDKALHVMAFTVLTMIAAAAYPHARPWKIIVSLSAFGALIEIVQAIPALNRDSDWLDWVADTAAVLITLGITLALRRLLRR